MGRSHLFELCSASIRVDLGRCQVARRPRGILVYRGDTGARARAGRRRGSQGMCAGSYTNNTIELGK
jgi:hypothetical protein